MGPRISWPKVVRGKRLEWCGAEVTVLGRASVRVGVSEKMIEEIREEVEDILEHSVIRLSRLRKLTGKASWAASLAPVIKSCLGPLWAVMGEVARAGSGVIDSKADHDPVIHVKRIKTALMWIRAYVRRLVGSGELARTVDANTWFGECTIKITCDASPWGIGATLEVEGVLVAWLADTFCQHDVEKLGIVIGSCKSQAVTEALAVLVALRAWLPTWSQGRATMVVRSDSQAALGALGKLSSPCPAINAIAREVAVDVASSRYGVDVWAHVAGVDNDLADALSRIEEPGSKALPGVFDNIARTPCCPRDPDWWEAWCDFA